MNPEHVQAVTGRKTERADAERLAFLLRHDLLAGSFIPAREQRELREQTRSRTALARERERVVQRLKKVLEGANSKLAMLDAALQGMTDPEELAGLAQRKLQPKRDLLVQALAGRLTRPLRFLAQQRRDHWRERDARITAFDTEIAEALRPVDRLVERLDAIPGVGRRKAALTEAAWAAARCKHGYLAAQYRRLAGRRGRKRAIVAVAHSLVTSLFFMLRQDIPFTDLGGDYFDQRDRDRREQRALATLRSLGYDVAHFPRPTPATPASEVA